MSSINKLKSKQKTQIRDILAINKKGRHIPILNLVQLANPKATTLRQLCVPQIQIIRKITILGKNKLPIPEELLLKYLILLARTICPPPVKKKLTDNTEFVQSQPDLPKVKKQDDNEQPVIEPTPTPTPESTMTNTVYIDQTTSSTINTTTTTTATTTTTTNDIKQSEFIPWLTRCWLTSCSPFLVGGLGTVTPYPEPDFKYDTVIDYTNNNNNMGIQISIPPKNPDYMVQLLGEVTAQTYLKSGIFYFKSRDEYYTKSESHFVINSPSHYIQSILKYEQEKNPYYFNGYKNTMKYYNDIVKSGKEVTINNYKGYINSVYIAAGRISGFALDPPLPGYYNLLYFMVNYDKCLKQFTVYYFGVAFTYNQGDVVGGNNKVTYLMAIKDTGYLENATVKDFRNNIPFSWVINNYNNQFIYSLPLSSDLNVYKAFPTYKIGDLPKSNINIPYFSIYSGPPTTTDQACLRESPTELANTYSLIFTNYNINILTECLINLNLYQILSQPSEQGDFPSHLFNDNWKNINSLNYISNPQFIDLQNIITNTTSEVIWKTYTDFPYIFERNNLYVNNIYNKPICSGLICPALNTGDLFCTDIVSSSIQNEIKDDTQYFNLYLIDSNKKVNKKTISNTEVFIPISNGNAVYNDNNLNQLSIRCLNSEKYKSTQNFKLQFFLSRKINPSFALLNGNILPNLYGYKNSILFNIDPNQDEKIQSLSLFLDEFKNNFNFYATKNFIKSIAVTKIISVFYNAFNYTNYDLFSHPFTKINEEVLPNNTCAFLSFYICNNSIINNRFDYFKIKKRKGLYYLIYYGFTQSITRSKLFVCDPASSLGDGPQFSTYLIIVYNIKGLQEIPLQFNGKINKINLYTPTFNESEKITISTHIYPFRAKILKTEIQDINIKKGFIELDFINTIDKNLPNFLSFSSNPLPIFKTNVEFEQYIMNHNSSAFNLFNWVPPTINTTPSCGIKYGLYYYKVKQIMYKCSANFNCNFNISSVDTVPHKYFDVYINKINNNVINSSIPQISESIAEIITSEFSITGNLYVLFSNDISCVNSSACPINNYNNCSTYDWYKLIEKVFSTKANFHLTSNHEKFIFYLDNSGNHLSQLIILDPTTFKNVNYFSNTFNYVYIGKNNPPKCFFFINFTKTSLDNSYLIYSNFQYEHEVYQFQWYGTQSTLLTPTLITISDNVSLSSVNLAWPCSDVFGTPINFIWQYKTTFDCTQAIWYGNIVFNIQNKYLFKLLSNHQWILPKDSNYSTNSRYKGGDDDYLLPKNVVFNKKRTDSVEPYKNFINAFPISFPNTYQAFTSKNILDIGELVSYPASETKLYLKLKIDSSNVYYIFIINGDKQITLKWGYQTCLENCLRPYTANKIGTTGYNLGIPNNIVTTNQGAPIISLVNNVNMARHK